MKKIEIVNLFNGENDIALPEPTIKKISDFLSDTAEYKLERKDDGFVIHTELKEGERGSYYEVSCEYDRETKNISVITMKKEYGPQSQIRYGFREIVGLNIFSDINSYVFDENGVMLYKSWFSDENKYFNNHEKMPLDYSVSSLEEYFKKTTPQYEKGVEVLSAESAHQPFTSHWKRLGNTHVYKLHSRNPMNGEHGEIGITFDDGKQSDQKLLNESYGQIYVEGRKLNFTGETNIANKIEEIYQSCCSDEGFDMERFNEEFESTMFQPVRTI